MKQPYPGVIDKLDLKTVLIAYEPTLIGTPPLKIDIETSDIDIACTAENLTGFVSTVTTIYSEHTDFSTEYFQTRGESAARCNFKFGGWEIELFCQTIPIMEQWGVRHYKVEKRLLQLEPKLRNHIIQLKRSGLKTEAAFARVLGLAGDPFEAVLELENWSDADLLDLLSRSLIASYQQIAQP